MSAFGNWYTFRVRRLRVLDLQELALRIIGHRVAFQGLGILLLQASRISRFRHEPFGPRLLLIQLHNEAGTD